MTISLTRIDERLIHGQVAYSRSVAYQIDEIVVIDNKISEDELQKNLLELAVPNGKSFKLFNINDGTKYLNEESNKKIFLVLKDPFTALSLVKNGVSIDSINVGGMYHREDRDKISKTIYLNNEERRVFKEIGDLGVTLEMRTSPKDRYQNLLNCI